jgi:hypothetical protein
VDVERHTGQGVDHGQQGDEGLEFHGHQALSVGAG